MRFRLFAPPDLGAVEFEAADAAELMARALAARAQLLAHGYVLLQVWSPEARRWCDPVYQHESRAFEVRAHATGYARLWVDVWGWCEEARIVASRMTPR